MRKQLIITLFLFLVNINYLYSQFANIENLKGESINFEELIKGKESVIVLFWATWCKPCQSELEAFKELQQEWKDKIRIIAITIDDSRAKSKVKALVSGKKWPFEIYIDTNKELYKALNLTSIPFSLLYRDGKKVLSHSGYNPGDELTILKEAMKTKGS